MPFIEVSRRGAAVAGQGAADAVGDRRGERLPARAEPERRSRRPPRPARPARRAAPAEGGRRAAAGGRGAGAGGAARRAARRRRAECGAGPSSTCCSGLIVRCWRSRSSATWARSLPRPEERQRQPAAARRPSRARRGGGRRRRAGPGAGAPDALVGAISDKDLFDQSRRPAPEEAGQAAAQEAAPCRRRRASRWSASASCGGEREAFIQDATQQNKQRRLRVGDQVAELHGEGDHRHAGDPRGAGRAERHDGRRGREERRRARPGARRRPAARRRRAWAATTVTIPRPTATSTTRPARRGRRGRAPSSTCRRSTVRSRRSSKRSASAAATRSPPRCAGGALAAGPAAM